MLPWTGTDIMTGEKVGYVKAIIIAECTVRGNLSAPFIGGAKNGRDGPDAAISSNGSIWCVEWCS